MMEAVKRGGDRQQLHEIIRRHSMAATARMKEGLPCDLLDRLAGDPAFGLSRGELEQLMEQRRSYRYHGGESRLRAAESVERYHLGVAAPIVAEGDLMGCVMLLMGEHDAAPTESEQTLAQTFAGFLGKQMES